MTSANPLEEVHGRRSSFSLFRLADFESVARLVAGDPAPDWLVEFFGKLAGSLCLDRGVHQVQPTRAEMRRDLEAIVGGRLTVDDFFSTDPVIHFLKEFGDSRTEKCRKLALEAVSERGRTKHGAGRSAPPGAISPMTYCALIVSEAWQYVHGVRPLPKNNRAREAAELFWRAAGGGGHFGPDDPYARWRYHFTLANRADQNRLRMEMRRRLALNRYFSELLGPSTKAG